MERTPLLDAGRLTISTKLAYALGHVFNDLAAAMWFSYTLIYLQRVALLEPIAAGALLLLGRLIFLALLKTKFCKSRYYDLMLKRRLVFKVKSSTRL